MFLSQIVKVSHVSHCLSHEQTVLNDDEMNLILSCQLVTNDKETYLPEPYHLLTIPIVMTIN
jgi:hypothetical protein